MKPEPLRVASPRFTRKRLILRWLHDAFCVLNSCLSSPVMRYEPTNYCRWVKGKNRNSVMCARALYSPVSPLLLLSAAWGRTRWRPSAKSSPISRKNAQGLSRLLLLFSDGTALRERAQGRLGDCAALFLRGARAVRSSRFPSARAPREVRGSRPNGTADARATAATASGFSVRFRHFAGAGPSFCVLFF